MLRGTGRDHGYAGVRRAPEHFTFTFTLPDHKAEKPDWFHGDYQQRAGTNKKRRAALMLAAKSGARSKRWGRTQKAQKRNGGRGAPAPFHSTRAWRDTIVLCVGVHTGRVDPLCREPSGPAPRGGGVVA